MDRSVINPRVPTQISCLLCTRCRFEIRRACAILGLFLTFLSNPPELASGFWPRLWGLLPLPCGREMATVSPFAEDVDVCRNRYDHLVRQGQGLGTDGVSSSSSGAAHGGGGHGYSRERRWLLELGAMTVLEAELETLSMDSSCASTAAVDRHHNDADKGRERERYRSCLETMLDGHYDTLGEHAVRSPATLDPVFAAFRLSFYTYSWHPAVNGQYHINPTSTAVVELGTFSTTHAIV